MFFSKALLIPIALLGCALFSSAHPQDVNFMPRGGIDLVAAYPDLKNAREEVINHQKNLTKILETVFDYTTGQAHDELTETLSDLQRLTTALTGPPPTFLANTGPGKTPTQNECSSVFADILNSLVQINLAIENLRPGAPSLHTDLQAIAAETVAALKAADFKFVISRKFIADHVDLESILHMHDGFKKIAIYLSEDQVTSQTS